MHDWQFPENNLPGWTMPDILPAYEFFRRELSDPKLAKISYNFQFSPSTSFRNIQKRYPFMANKGKTTNAKKSDAPTGSGQRKDIRWINVSLDESDALALESMDYTIDSLASGLVALAVEGWDISLKTNRSDNSRMATAITDDPHTIGSGVGVSGWSDNFADAIASLLYKVHDKLGGEVPAPSERPSRRFR